MEEGSQQSDSNLNWHGGPKIPGTVMYVGDDDGREDVVVKRALQKDRTWN